MKDSIDLLSLAYRTDLNLETFHYLSYIKHITKYFVSVKLLAMEHLEFSSCFYLKVLRGSISLNNIFGPM